MSFIDAARPRERNYFYSIYFQTPAGAMFEATWTHPQRSHQDESLAEVPAAAGVARGAKK